MTERPILFSAPMVKAILAGRKTVTRRVAKPQPPDWVTEFGYSIFTAPGMISGRGNHPEHGPAEASLKRRWEKGDRLWVRETWGLRRHYDVTDWLRDSMKDRKVAASEWALDYCADWDTHQEACFWRPSIFMPRWASRITLEVIGVTVERLQEITEEQAKAEGVTPLGPSLGADQRIAGEDRGRTQGTHPYTLAYAVLWDELNADRGFGWVTNPWVWSIGFRRLTP